ncbi:outer membrane lipoprotein-sorting protein [Candidatus Margulisiibacteriota bacterium]
MKKIALFLLFLFCSAILLAAPPSAEFILKKIDDNYTAETRKSTVTLIIKGRRGTRTLKARSWARGIERSFTEYLSPPREKGTKMLKLENELWIYSPQADRIIKIAGHMLRQSMMGSDMSYEDMMEDPVLANVYSAELTGEEIVNSRNCYVLKLTAKKDDASYHFRKIWVDKVRYLPLREDRFAKSGKLLKVTNITKVFKTGGRWYPKRIVFKDALKTGEGTEIIIDSIAFNAKVPRYIFSKAALRK